MLIKSFLWVCDLCPYSNKWKTPNDGVTVQLQSAERLDYLKDICSESNQIECFFIPIFDYYDVFD